MNTKSPWLSLSVVERSEVFELHESLEMTGRAIVTSLQDGALVSSLQRRAELLVKTTAELYGPCN